MKHFHAVFFLLLVNLLLPSLGWFDALADNSSKVVTAGALMPVEHEAEFRRSIGFRSDEAYIRSVRRADNSIVVPELGNVLLTPEEFEELRVRLELEKDVDILVEFFAGNSELQKTFGGLYIEHYAGAEDHKRGGKLVVQLVENQVHVQRALELVELNRPDRLQIEWVKFSLVELQEQYDKLALLNTPAFQGIFLHTKLNHVGVIMDLPLGLAETQIQFSKDSLPLELYYLLSHPAINVYYGSIEVEQVVLRGGDSWGKTANARHCTLGFKVRDNSTGRYGMVTAGHCVTELGLQIGSRAYSGSRMFGYVTRYIDGASSPYGAGIDAAYIRTRLSGTATDDVNYFTSYFDVVGETADYTIGRIRCFSGQVSGTKCSPITCQNQQFTYNGRYYTRLFTIDADNTNGDSGSPVFEVVGQTNTARITGVLITRMRDAVGQSSCLNGWDGGVSRWEDVKNYLDLSLVTTR